MHSPSFLLFFLLFTSTCSTSISSSSTAAFTFLPFTCHQTTYVHYKYIVLHRDTYVDTQNAYRYRARGKSPASGTTGKLLRPRAASWTRTDLFLRLFALDSHDFVNCSASRAPSKFTTKSAHVGKAVHPPESFVNVRPRVYSVIHSIRRLHTHAHCTREHCCCIKHHRRGERDDINSATLSRCS